MYRMLDHNEKLKKVRRGQSAYKRHLVEKIIEKSNRGREISERKFRVSEIAIQNSQLIRDQFQNGVENLKEIDRNYKMDLNHKNIYSNAKNTSPLKHK